MAHLNASVCLMAHRLIVHCGRCTADWLKVTHIDGMSYFNGFGKKKNATLFASEAQAKGAIKMHCVQQRLKKPKHKIMKVEVKE